MIFQHVRIAREYWTNIITSPHTHTPLSPARSLARSLTTCSWFTARAVSLSPARSVCVVANECVECGHVCVCMCLSVCLYGVC